MRLFAGAVARHYGCGEATIDDLKLAMSEACNHAGAALVESGEPSSVTATMDEDRVHFNVRSGGHSSLAKSEERPERAPTLGNWREFSDLS